MLNLKITEDNIEGQMTFSEDIIEYVMDEKECTEEEAINILRKRALKKLKKKHTKMKRSKAMKNFIMSGHPHARTMWNRRFRQDIPTKYYLNVECTQFTIGKTGKTLDRVSLSNAAKIHKQYSDSEEKVISIIITSCNLAETAQWRVRTKNKFGNVLNICTLSSKTKATKTGSGNKIGDFIAGLVNTDNKNLPDILLMCAHSKRVKEDLITLLKSQKRIVSTSGKQFKFNLFFDEADRNIKLITESLKKIRNEVDQDTGYKMDTYLNEVHFITATPVDEFWSALKKIGINDLDNFDIEFGKKYTPEEREKALNQYQSILTQTFIDFQGRAVNAFDTIKMVMESDNIPSINENKQNIIFAPGDNTLVSHHAIKDYFIENGYYVLMHNGKHKGIYDPAGNFKSLDEYNIDYGLVGEKYEIRDTLRKWQLEHPNASLGVTGWFTITRGLTFNTNGFNFTHMIFCWNHSKNFKEFVQVLGRCCGHKDYCDNIEIIGPKDMFEKAQDFVKNLLELKAADVDKYNEKQFKKNKANEGILYESFDNWQDARRKVISIHPRCNPYNIGRTNESVPKTDDKGFYHNNIRSKTEIMKVDYILSNRCWGINKNNKYRIHVGYTDVNNKNTCQWIVCYGKEYIKKEEVVEEKKISILEAFNKK